MDRLLISRQAAAFRDTDEGFVDRR